MKTIICAVIFACLTGSAMAQAVPQPTPEQQRAVNDRINAAALNESVAELHNAQNQIITLQAQITVLREDMTMSGPRLKHADDMDAWVKGYFGGPTAPTPPTAPAPDVAEPAK